MRVIASGILVLLVASSSPAATAIRASIEQLGRQAVVVARVRCRTVESRFTEDRSTIETHIDLETLEVLGGSLPEKITVLCRGGTVGDKSLRIAGQAVFAPGEEDVVFLRKDPRGAWRVLGWCQGKFRVVRDPETGKATATQDFAGLCFVRREEDPPTSRKPESLALEDLVRRVRAVREETATEGEAKTEEDGKTTPPEDEGSGENGKDRTGDD